MTADRKLIPEALASASVEVDKAIQWHFTNPKKIAEAAVRGYLAEADRLAEIASREREKQAGRFALCVILPMAPAFLASAASLIYVMRTRDAPNGNLVFYGGVIASGLIYVSEILFFAGRKLLRALTHWRHTKTHAIAKSLIR